MREPQPQHLGESPAPTPVILVVDDDADVLEAFWLLLREEGYDVVLANDGQQALQLLREGLRPSLLVLDIVMPQLNGNSLLDLLRADPELAATPVVLMTAMQPAPPVHGDSVIVEKTAAITVLLTAFADALDRKPR